MGVVIVSMVVMRYCHCWCGLLMSVSLGLLACVSLVGRNLESMYLCCRYNRERGRGRLKEFGFRQISDGEELEHQ